jgi:pilus assembly protein Flp/PilA
MRHLKNAVVNFMKREDGPTAVEYAVMLALIIVVCITAITALGTNANKTSPPSATSLPARAAKPPRRLRLADTKPQASLAL